MTLFLSHRGESDDAPENTLAAYQLAIDRKSDGIELDVRLTSDRRLVCIHDGDLLRVAGDPAVVAETTLADLQTVHPVPLLREVLEILPQGMCLQIELKGSDPELPGRLKTELDAGKADPAQLVLTSFESETIKNCAPLFPELPRLRLINLERVFGQIPAPEALREFLRALDCTGVSFRAAGAVDANYVRQLHDLGLLAVCWGVSSDELGLRMAAAGVDAMTCNHAVALRELWRRQTGQSDAV